MNARTSVVSLDISDECNERIIHLNDLKFQAHDLIIQGSEIY